uniref:NADH dehydrogenase subunit 6 n=1 Tax=Dictyocaulus eckerti TaxID=44604 RepID=K7QM74_DICEC|nr:NADH dehydrogenase subunit 6 [Dictyocaulus eckerti]AFV32095.1 NADH dehydrogenase subunit 6 [Dictyocaulus eckerti]
MSLIFCMFSYVNVDPIKSCFFLILSMICSMVFLSSASYVWYSYFVCLLFLSGVFVILVYFSSLSNFLYKCSYLFFVVFLFSFFYCCVSMDLSLMKNVSMMCFYYYICIPVIIFLTFFLLFYINFMSFYLSFSGALRSL